MAVNAGDRRRPTHRTVVAGLLALVLAGACTWDEQAGPERGPATPLDPANTGILAGSVQFRGTPPESSRIRMGGDATCTQAHEGPVSARDVLVRDGRVQNAFVYVAEGLGDRVFERPSEPVVIDQKGCLYVPKVLGVQTGQPIRFVNSDATLHNVHTAPENSPGTNFGMAVEGGQRDVRIPKPEVMVRVKCDVHPWMQAWIGVLDHPYFSVTAEDGRFRFEKVPEGAFTVAVWHERFGPLERPARVNAGETTTMEFVYDADGSP